MKVEDGSLWESEFGNLYRVRERSRNLLILDRCAGVGDVRVVSKEEFRSFFRPFTGDINSRKDELISIHKRYMKGMYEDMRSFHGIKEEPPSVDNFDYEIVDGILRAKLKG